MKILQAVFTCLLQMLVVVNVFSQETIYTTDGAIIEAEISAIDGKSVSFKPIKKNAKATVLKPEQISIIVFENGHYLTFPNPKMSMESIKEKKTLPNDVILTKYVDVLEGTITNTTSEKIDFYNIKSNMQTSIKLDEVLMVINKNGDHTLYRKAPEIRVFLEHMQPEVIALIETAPSSISAASSSPGRPAHLSGNPQTSAASVSTQSYASESRGNNLAQSEERYSPPAAQQSATVMVQSTGAASATVDNVSQSGQNSGVQVTQPMQSPQQVQSGNINGTTANSNFNRNASTNRPSELTDIDFDEFSDKALQKIEDFTGYLGIIASKETYPESANQAIELAIELFVSEDVQVEVSTAGFSSSMKRKIRDYLNRLKLLKYDRVDIQWANINYVSNFRKAPDGNYYGTVSVQQTFRGYKDNQVVYSDVTTKDVEVVIKGMEKSVQGQIEMVWDVLLSDIGVVDTK
ncbi:hypothetical protein [Mongoliitalea lutea]|uniref:Uncharacterized protein n=1 Tax=Mongoliitalea lutea TaxID=849756 RepID=A0A8J3G4G8_9BACT|nr:hypothetical protein [Mongoliitalea lutea]GHB29420.1 hypothetical protein GCM10008106_07950 [Mongoliitalea lutea]